MADALALPLPGVEVPPLSCRLDVNLWGFDISTRRIALGVVQSHDRKVVPEVGWFSYDVEQHSGGARRLAGIMDTFPTFVRRVAGVAAPTGLLLEQPYGQGKARPHPQSYYVVGVALAILAVEFPAAHLAVVEPTSWKCEALGEGKGFATKPMVLGWAQATLGYTGDCDKCHGLGKGKCDHACRAHDEADSLGVVTSAAIRWARDGRLR